MKLYNSLTQQVEPLKPMEEGKVSMYVCGPTVYNYPHIGNARPIVVFDTLKKALEADGYGVTFVSNYTDVDDKIINKAIEQNTTESEITDKYIEAYEETRKALHADLPDAAPRVTKTMDKIIDFISDLVDKGAAYQAGDDVYYRVKSDETYGELSHQNTDDLMVGARIDENTQKENPLDFTLWKKTDKGIQWDSPWGKGRPGWHTECVVMIRDVFQKPLIDIHGGGLDLKFPHHENEIAQSRSVSGTPLANMWVHNGMINVDNNKMAKSVGNVIWAKDLIEEYGSNVVRWLMISTHYRAPLNFTTEAISSSQKELEKIQTALHKAEIQLQLDQADDPDARDQEAWNAFMEAMNDDLNTPNAITALQSLLKSLNGALRKRPVDDEALAGMVNTLRKELYVLGIEFPKTIMSDQDREDYAAWRAAVKAKNFDEADIMRAKLQEKGIL